MDKKNLLVFSVGNPGRSNRHSAGHLGLKYLMEQTQCKQLVKPSSKSVYSMSKCETCTFVKSTVYMNESARALKLVMDDERLSLNQWNIVVVYDDFETNLGTVKLAEFKKNESHNGIKSIKNFVASLNVDCSVFKLGIGIGPKPANSTKESMATWVLSPFNQAELQLLQSTSFPTLYIYIHTIEDSDFINVNKLNATVKRLIQNS